MATPPAPEAAAATEASSQRLCELLDEVARKESALQQFRALFDRLCRDYEVEQRNAAQAKLELETLLTRHETQRQELVAAKAKNALQEARIKEEDSAWDRRTRQLRQELAAAVEERDALASEREAQWRQTRALRSQLQEQQRQDAAVEEMWKCRLDDVRREAEKRAQAGMQEREELLRLREAELQRGTSQLEGRLADAAAEARRQQETNEALMLRMEDLQCSLRRQEGMTQRVQGALQVEQKEKAQLGEYIALERQTHRQRLEQTENSYKAQVQEMQRLCDQHTRERERLESEMARFQRESQQEAQRTRELWLQQKQQLEATIESLRGDLTRERMRFDKADESHQRVEALLLRSRRELEAAQQQEAVLQETIASLHRAAAKRDATQVRLEGEITRLIAAVAERERETERWRSAVDRMEWQSRLESERVLPEPLPPPPLLPLSASPVTRRRGPARRSARATPKRPPTQQAESIDRTPAAGSPLTADRRYSSHVEEDEEAEVLRSLVQEVLQGCMETHTEPSAAPTHTSAAAAVCPAFETVDDRQVRTPRHRTRASRARGPAQTGDTRLGEDSLQNGVPSPSPITRATPQRDAGATGRRAPVAAAPTLSSAPSPSTTVSANSSILQAAAPLFTSASNNSYLDSSTVSQPQRKWLSSGGANGDASHHSVDSPLTATPAGDTDIAATAVLIQKYARERAETEQQMRQTLHDLEQRQQQLLFTVQGGVAAADYTDASVSTRKEERNGNSVRRHNTSVASSASLITAHASSRASSAQASTAAPGPPSRLLLLQERFETMPMAQ
ncbi:hypothetical protein TRSC58_02475 [Trypanosoma rangeli SC58]|uniref:Uncharacterized protein n=1 Tax=Trypanosoma rangeli SC58 TaxID=429131 RepID=A0A061J635_TRYRA|nr:hypothetical protein TRSC58_02475 [Trypanosoma rangeli SC58]